MKKKCKKFIVFSLAICMFSPNILFSGQNGKHTVYAYDQSTQKETSILNKTFSLNTLNDIEKFLFEYFRESNLNYSLGSQDYITYLMGLLNEDKDEVLKQHPQYDDILFYAAEYVVASQTVESSDNKTQSNAFNAKDPIKNIKNKDINAIKKENLDDNKVADNSNNKITSDNNISSRAYNGNVAANYAVAWAGKRNLNQYPSYDSDCTNFVSQALRAGGAAFNTPKSIPQNTYNTTSYWYFSRTYVTPKYRNDVSTSWLNVVDFHAYWSKYKNVRVETKTGNIAYYGRVGDIVQFRRKADAKWYHSTMITRAAYGTVYLSSHTSDYANKDITSIVSHMNYRLISF